MNYLVRRIARSVIRRSYSFGLFYVHARSELPHILNARKLLGEGAEIGVHRGGFSKLLLEQWRGRKLYSIDPWQEYPLDEYRDILNTPQAQQERFFVEASDKLDQFGTRSQIMRYTSRQAADCFADGQLDFVYIDAQHHYTATREDLALWYPKIKKGGILAGHDYLDGTVNRSEFGVRSAVNEFVAGNNLKVVISRERRFPSWFVLV